MKEKKSTKKQSYLKIIQQRKIETQKFILHCVCTVLNAIVLLCMSFYIHKNAETNEICNKAPDNGI